MSRLLISDANILIDLEVGGLILDLFKLPYQIQVPEMLFADELEADHGYLLEHGLRLGELSAASMVEVAILVNKYKQPSRYDCFALQLAKQEQIEVKGTLWVVESLVSQNIIDLVSARKAYALMKNNGRRLPWELTEKRLQTLQSGDKE